MSPAQKTPRGDGTGPGLHNDLVVAAATHVPSPSPDLNQPWGQEAPRSSRHHLAPSSPLRPGAQSPHVQSSGSKGWLFPVSSLPAGSWSCRTRSVNLNLSPLPPPPPVRQCLGLQVWISKESQVHSGF